MFPHSHHHHLPAPSSSSSPFSSSAPAPRLTESKITSYLNSVLVTCHATRTKVYSFFFNALVLGVFVLVFGSALWICRSNRLTPEAKQQKDVMDREYILANVRRMQAESAQSWFQEYLSPVEQARQRAVQFG